MMNKEYIYALVHWVDGKKKYFYVGRTARPEGVRFNEHIRAAWGDKLHTDVYRYIREHVQCQIFEEEILAREEDYDIDTCEAYWVIKLILEGHELQNEKHGDARRIAAQEEAHYIRSNNISMNSVSDLMMIRKERIRARSAEFRKRVHEEADNSHSVMNNLLSGIKPTEEELEERKRLKEKQRAAKYRAELAYEKHLEFLKQQEHLFADGKIDALGNEIKGEQQ